MAKKKNKKIYAKDRTPYITTDLEIDNPMRLVIAVKGKDKSNVWSEYIDRVIYRNEKTGLSPMDDLKKVLSYIENKQTRNGLVKSLMNIKDYNPFTDNIPLDKMPQNHAVFIRKIQDEIHSKMESIKSLKIQDRDFTLDSTKYKAAIFEFTKENYNKEVFELGYDMIILYKEGRFLINSNPNLGSARPNLEDLYVRLNKSEPNKWFLYGNKYMLKTEREATSHFNLKQMLLFIKQM